MSVWQAVFCPSFSLASWPILYFWPPKITIKCCFFCLPAVTICPGKVCILRFIPCTQIRQFPRGKCSYRNSAQFFQLSSVQDLGPVILIVSSSNTLYSLWLTFSCFSWHVCPPQAPLTLL